MTNNATEKFRLSEYEDFSKITATANRSQEVLSAVLCWQCRKLGNVRRILWESMRPKSLVRMCTTLVTLPCFTQDIQSQKQRDNGVKWRSTYSAGSTHAKARRNAESYMEGNQLETTSHQDETGNYKEGVAEHLNLLLPSDFPHCVKACLGTIAHAAWQSKDVDPHSTVQCALGLHGSRLLALVHVAVS